MYYLVELRDRPLYEVVGEYRTIPSFTGELTDTNIVVSESFLEDYFSLIRQSDVPFFPISWDVSDLKSRAVVDLQEASHFILIEDKWETCVKLKRATANFFQFYTAEGIQIFTKKFRLGEPFQ